MTELKPLFLVNLFGLNPPSNGGASRIARNVCRLLVAMAKNHELELVFVVGFDFACQFAQWLGEPNVCVIPCLQDRGVNALVRSLGPDVIVSPLFGMQPFEDYNTAQGIPHIVHMPDALALDKPEYFDEIDLGMRRKLYESLKGASHVITLSESSKSKLVTRAGLSEERVFIAYGSVDTLLPDPVHALSLQRYKPYLFYPANDWPHKRHRLLAPILKEIWKTNPQYNLLLTGHHAADFQITNGFSELKSTTGSGVYDLGFVADECVRDLYENAEALLFVSEYEGFGIPLLEALHYGCPVITSPATSIPEVVGEAAILVRSEDPLEWASAVTITLPLQKERLVRDGKLRASLFTQQKMDESWKRAFQEAASCVKKTASPFSSHERNLISEELLAWCGRYFNEYSQYRAQRLENQRLAQTINEMEERRNREQNRFRHFVRSKLSPEALAALQKIRSLLSTTASGE